MKKIIVSIIVLLAWNAQAQNVGINATGASPATAAALDIDMTNKGLLIPRVALTTTTVFAPVTGTPVTSLLVYNTATAGVSPTDVTPGYYYWDGTQWLRLSTGNAAAIADDWKLLGNAGTSPTINFLGTTDDNDLIFRRNNIRGGRLGVTSTSFGTNALNTGSTGPGNTAVGVNALASHTTAFNNTAVGYNTLTNVTGFGANTAVGAYALRVNANTFSTSIGAFAGENTTGGYNAIFGYSAMRNNLGGANVAIGFNALLNGNNTNNIGIGYETMRDNAGSNNIALGYQSAFGSNIGNYNVVIGDQAGYGANLTNSIAIGKGALKNSTGGAPGVQPYSFIGIGEEALNQTNAGLTTKIGIGYRALSRFNGFRAIAIGDQSLDGGAANAATNGQDVIAIGNEVMRNCAFCDNNIGIGFRALTNANNAAMNVVIGNNAGYGVIDGDFNTIIGMATFDGGVGSNNVVVGNAINKNASYWSENNVLLGSGVAEFAGYLNGNVFIGRNVGNFLTSFDDTENRLMIDNSGTTTPLIYGEFDNNILRANGILQVSDPSVNGYAFPTVDGTAGQVMVTDGFGTVSWQNASGGGNDWSLIGNAGTTPTTNFIGTTDAQDFVMKTTNVERARIDANGFMGVNAAPDANTRLYVEQTGASAISGIWGSTQAAGSAGVIGTGGNSLGYGVFGDNSASGPGVFGYSTSTASATRSAVIGMSQGTTWVQLTGYNIGGAFTGQVGVSGYSVGSAATTRFAGSFIYDMNNNASNIDATSPRAQLAGYDATQSLYYGGYFAGGQDYTGTFNGANAGNHANAVDYVFVGTRIGATNYKIVGNGSVSTIIDGEQDEKHIMFAPEAPEILFQDFGVGQLVNGVATIAIDPIIAKNIYVDDQHPLKVFIQLKGDCNGVFVTAESAEGFTVKELQGGSSNVSFSYQIVANRADRKDANGNVLSKHVDVRLPAAPNSLELAEPNMQNINHPLKHTTE